jgi:hypothetical protein
MEKYPSESVFTGSEGLLFSEKCGIFILFAQK